MTIRYVERSELSVPGRTVVGLLATLLVAGAYAAHYMEQMGHHVTGMTNQIVWGVPHVFAITLIVAASGALNVASLASVFHRDGYLPFARLSVLVAVSLLVGGLAILVLDLGRPDRLSVALSHYNFTSLFAWNVFLYTGFIALALVYLWTLMEGRLQTLSGAAGVAALAWRVALTSATGCIFGFLVARPAYNAAVVAPLFIAMSLSVGLAVFLLVALPLLGRAHSLVDDAFRLRAARLLSTFVWANFYLVVVHHAASFYTQELRDFERFVLLEGGRYSAVFWVGQIGIGTLGPLVMLRTRGAVIGWRRLITASTLVLTGVSSQLYVLIIAYQAYPLTLFRDKTVVESSFYDGAISAYTPSLPELALGLGGVALALLVVLAGLRVLRLMPASQPEGRATGKSVR